MRLVKTKLRSRTLGAALLALALFASGFFVFAAYATRELPTDTGVAADAVVALTGGGRRIGAAAAILEQRRARRLLISGVNRVTSTADVRRLTNLPANWFACCVDVGYEAQDTTGNAAEAGKWVRKNGFKSLIVVTASYHMPRSLAEFTRQVPDVVVYAHPVEPGGFSNRPWWLDPQMTRVLIGEYLKFLPAAARWVLARAIGNGSEPLAPETPKAPAGAPLARSS